MMLKQSEVDAHEEEIRLAVRDLPDEVRKCYFQQAESRLKDPDTYAVLNYLFIAGLHHFYLGRWIRGLINLVVFGGGVYLLFLEQWKNGLIVIAVITVLELYALFRSQIIVQHYNNCISEEILDSIEHS